MKASYDNLHAKVVALFGEIPNSKVSGLDSENSVAARISRLMSSRITDNAASNIGFHLTDWLPDAAHLVAFAICPDRFSDEEVSIGINNLLIHAPNHLAAAAKLSGYPVKDVFGIGNIIEDDD